MTQQIVNIGINANDGTGDTERAAFGKVNANFAELYALVSTLGNSINVTAAPGGSNNVNPAGFGPGVGAILVTLTANSNWTGLVAGTEGQTVRLTVVSGAFTLTLNNQNVGSASANRFQGAGDFVITLNSSLLLQYRAALNGGNGAWSMA